MPNYYAHLYFGEEVLRRLSAPLAKRLRAEHAAFRVGCYGPDPLFFHGYGREDALRELGLTMHHQSVRLPAQRLLELVREGRSGAAGYAGGFLCHFALDSACHPYIEARSAAGLSHFTMELELDRVLLERDGLDPLRDLPMPHALPPKQLETAAAVYPGVTPQEFCASLGAFWRVTRAQVLAGGTPLSALARALSRHFPSLGQADGVLLERKGRREYAVSTTLLLELLESAVGPGAAAVEEFFALASDGGELGEWFSRDFSGGPRRGEGASCPPRSGTRSS